MRFVLYISEYLIPLVFIYIVGFGLISKVPLFDEFIEGAKDGFKVVFSIMPTLIGLMVAVGILRASGALDFLTMIITPVTNILKFPSEIVPIALMRTVSSSATTGLVLDLFKTYGPDSLIGRMTSIMMGCTETIFYTLSVYFLAINIRKTRYTITGALLANLAGIVFSVYITYSLFG
ncbi:spore maturation protein B [Natranaerovirga pectinivora]|uniref:Spore maturation protein B n=1 Tax=Natranaerovirga pectinivora TaxID=682400 RepID=A0A4R3MD59_9FIRM|nr:nucleoside recognition domain-containing protein [Natranaerovirga pectinivora]TCT11674.1 spore maturation protein B [Natranaerovirga pectinivora]